MDRGREPLEDGKGLESVKGLRKAEPIDLSQTLIPNYGRGAFYGLAGTVAAAIVWAAYQVFTDSYAMLMPAAAGWFASACVKRGMGSVDATGLALSIYFTAMIVFLGEFFFFSWHFFSNTGRLSLAGPIGRLFGYYRGNPKALFFMILFTGLGFVVAVINCRESGEKKRRGKTTAPGNDEKETKGEEPG
jgi:hypothetical protein